MQRLLRDNEQNVLSTQMNTMFGEMMSNAAVAEQQQRQIATAVDVAAMTAGRRVATSTRPCAISKAL